MAWQQLRFFANPNQAELLSDLLLGLGSLAVTFEDSADNPIYEPDLHHIALWQQTTVTALFPEGEDLNENIIEKIKLIMANEELPPFEILQLEDQNWEQAWLAHFKPINFGNGLWICPSSHDIPEPDAINVILDPGLAFGTGTHPTTALCLEWLGENPPVDKTFIDYGCGSGILSIAALKLGAKQVTAVDISEQALLATKDNCEKNQLSLDKISILLPQAFSHQTKADIIIANILLKPLQELAPLFSTLLNENGTLVLSGILAEQKEALDQIYGSLFKRVDFRQKEDWLCVVYSH